MWLIVGLGLGLAAGLLLPHTPAHAVATDRNENFAICTTMSGNGTEAVCVLDALTGDLTAYVLSPQLATFNAMFKYNIAGDLAVQPNQNPKFLLVSGTAQIQNRGAGMGNLQIGSLVYVAEVKSGKIAAYAIPYTQNMAMSNQPIAGTFLKVAILEFRNQAGVRPPVAQP